MFAMALDIPEDQQQICLDMSRAFWLQIALVNDYYSWDAEEATAKNQGLTTVANAIWVLMNKHAMTLEEAKSACAAKAHEYAEEYLRVLEEAKAREDLCRDAKTLLDMQRFSISGHLAWRLQSPRYDATLELNPAQMAMAEAVWADDTLRWGPGQKKAVDGVAGQFHEQAKAAARDVPPLKTTVRVFLCSIFSIHYCWLRLPELTPECQQTLDEPSRYLDSLPGKGIRDKVIDALNIWYKVSPEDTAVIKKIINLLHGASLMLDDIQDSSELRRGKPATHMVFGSMQTINSAGYRFLVALNEVRKLCGDGCMDAFCGKEFPSLLVKRL